MHNSNGGVAFPSKAGGLARSGKRDDALASCGSDGLKEEKVEEMGSARLKTHRVIGNRFPDTRETHTTKTKGSGGTPRSANLGISQPQVTPGGLPLSLVAYIGLGGHRPRWFPQDGEIGFG
jgi:hypothetical protein